MSKLKKSILGWVGDRVFAPARISSVEKISEHFRLIHLESPSFAKLHWRPGEKIQINVGDWNVRTYTPIALNPFISQIKLLAFVHGNGPGSEWARDVKRGDLCQVFGPRSSLDVSEEERPRVLFGDETSFAAAIGLKTYFGYTGDLQFIFEVDSIEESKQVCEKFGIAQNAVFFEKEKEGSHLPALLKSIESHLYYLPKKQFILTGNAKSVQAVRNHLRESQRLGLETMTKAYWALGRVGLD